MQNTESELDASVSEIDSEYHDKVRGRLEQLTWKRDDCKKRLAAIEDQRKQISDYLVLAPEVSDALKTLGSDLFEQDIRVLEQKMTIALQEVLKQPVIFKAETGFKGNVATVEFSIEKDGNSEDIRRGQGGSVHNILSVGLRMFALTMLDGEKHWPFLMLDEQDCWLQPELVPSLVKIVDQAGKELGYQVIMISHHELTRFSELADKIYRFEPNRNGTSVVEISV